MENKSEIKITFTEESQARAVAVEGQIGHLELSDFQEKMDQILLLPENNILMDLSRVTYISSSGLRILLKLAKEAENLKKNLILFNLSEFVSSVFKVSGFDKIFKIKGSKEEALKSFPAS